MKGLDKDVNELISVDELKRAIIESGEKFPLDEIEKMIKEADIDGDGYINYDEFMKIMIFK